MVFEPFGFGNAITSYIPEFKGLCPIPVNYALEDEPVPSSLRNPFHPVRSPRSVLIMRHVIEQSSRFLFRMPRLPATIAAVAGNNTRDWCGRRFVMTSP